MKKVFIFLFICVTFSSCFNHQYIVTKSSQPREDESTHIRFFTLMGFVPVYRDIDQETVCPERKIRMINMYDSGLTLFLICPHTVGIECVD